MIRGKGSGGRARKSKGARVVRLPGAASFSPLAKHLIGLSTENRPIEAVEITDKFPLATRMEVLTEVLKLNKKGYNIHIPGLTDLLNRNDRAASRKVKQTFFYGEELPRVEEKRFMLEYVKSCLGKGLPNAELTRVSVGIADLVLAEFKKMGAIDPENKARIARRIVKACISGSRRM